MATIGPAATAPARPRGRTAPRSATSDLATPKRGPYSSKTSPNGASPGDASWTSTCRAELTAYLATLDAFIADKIAPLQAEHDNERFFDHRREWARTDWDGGGLPRREWEELLGKARGIADAAGHYRFALPKDYGGQDGSNLWMAVIREHLAAKGLGLFNDLQNEHSIVGNNPFVLMIRDFGRPDQQHLIADMLDRHAFRPTFGLTEPNHGSDATFMETRAVREEHHGQPGWRIDGEKMWTTGMHAATHCALFARTSGEDGSAKGITCFLVPAHAPGVKIEEYLWTFNMPTDHPRVSFTQVWVPDDGDVRSRGRRPGPGPALRAREPHPPGGLQPGRGDLLHRGEHQGTRARASRSARPWPRTRRSSSRWSSCRPRPRCCAC